MSNKNGKPYLPDLDTLYQLGINPKTGLPMKFGGSKVTLKEDTKRFLRIVDEQTAVNRYIWENIPCNITSQELERMLYYRGQLCFFKLNDNFYFTPYALDGTIDFYGRYNQIHPVPFNGGEDNKTQAKLLEEIKLDVFYDIPSEPAIPEKSAVLLHDYTKQMSQTVIPRSSINEPLLDVMANCIPYMNTSMLLSTGIKGMRVADADQADSVHDANKSMERAALVGEAYIPIIGAIDFQELSNEVGEASSYMMAFQSLDNLRLTGYGVKTGGIFEKGAQVLQAEEDVNSGPVEFIMKDGLDIRQHFCDIVNAIHGTNISVRENQIKTGGFTDGDTEIFDEETD